MPLNLLVRGIFLLPILLVLVVIVCIGIWFRPVDPVVVTRRRIGCITSFDWCNWISGWCGKLSFVVPICTWEDWMHWRDEA